MANMTLYGNMGSIFWPSGGDAGEAVARQDVYNDLMARFGNPANCDEAKANLANLVADRAKYPNPTTVQLRYQAAEDQIIPKLQDYLVANCGSVPMPQVTPGTDPLAITPPADNQKGSIIPLLAMAAGAAYLISKNSKKKNRSRKK